MMVAGYSTKGNAFVAEKPRLWSNARYWTGNNTRDVDVAPDGKRMIVVLDPPLETPTHVNLLLNFFDEVRRRAPAKR